MINKSEKVQVDSAQVSDYLRKNPDFLVTHPDLLNILAPPQDGRMVMGEMLLIYKLPC